MIMSSLIEPSSGSLLCSDGYRFTVFLTPLITSTPWAAAVWRIGLPPPASGPLHLHFSLLETAPEGIHLVKY